MILVTGASGKIGSQVIQHLLNFSVPVRAFVRDETRTAQFSDTDLETAVGTFEDTDSIKNALEGVDRVLLIGRDNPDQAQQHQNVIRQAEESGVKHIVKLSAFGADKHSTIELMRAHGEIESEIKTSSMRWSILQPHLYMQNLLRFSQEMFYDSLINQGHPSWRSYDLSHISNAYNNDNKHIITTDIEDILKRPPRSIDTFLNDFKQLFKNRSL